MTTRPYRPETLRERTGAAVRASFFEILSRSAKLHPKANLARHGVAVERNLGYDTSGNPDHAFDVYRPINRPGPWPTVFYVHGGGFRVLSKDTHWIMGLMLAKYGYMTVVINYRLAPKHPFPAAIEDTCRAYAWFGRHLQALGGDPSRVAIAGESAGGNLASGLALAMAQRRSEPWARDAFDHGPVPRAVLPFCGMLEVSRPERFAQRRPIPRQVSEIIVNTATSYIQDASHDRDGELLDLLDPLVALERGPRLDRPLPPFFLSVGTRDPLLDDQRRMEKALGKLGVPHESRYYPGGVHAFFAFVWDELSKQCWRDALGFLERQLRPAPQVAQLRAV